VSSSFVVVVVVVEVEEGERVSRSSLNVAGLHCTALGDRLFSSRLLVVVVVVVVVV
jgi:hypothetical protein